jgi:hypothetical protein
MLRRAGVEWQSVYQQNLLFKKKLKQLVDLVADFYLSTSLISLQDSLGRFVEVGAMRDHQLHPERAN